MRANRVAVEAVADKVFIATFFKTHRQVGTINSADTDWEYVDADNRTTNRENFRKYAISKAEEIGVEWMPDYQAQAWNRKYWKYENDNQVEEDAIELMRYTINKICTGCKYDVEVKEITLDSIVPMESNLSYVEKGKYIKNGNWAVAQVNLEVEMEINGIGLDIIYPIEMRSGNLTKIKLTKLDIDAMIEDTGVVEKIG